MTLKILILNCFKKSNNLKNNNLLITEREGVRNLIMGQYETKWDKIGRFSGDK